MTYISNYSMFVFITLTFGFFFCLCFILCIEGCTKPYGEGGTSDAFHYERVECAKLFETPTETHYSYCTVKCAPGYFAYQVGITIMLCFYIVFLHWQLTFTCKYRDIARVPHFLCSIGHAAKRRGEGLYVHEKKPQKHFIVSA